jgi:hypothetical protein
MPLSFSSAITINGLDVDGDHIKKVFFPEGDEIRDFQMPCLDGETLFSESILVYLHRSGLFDIEGEPDASMTVTAQVLKSFAQSVDISDFDQDEFARRRIKARNIGVTDAVDN